MSTFVSKNGRQRHYYEETGTGVVLPKDDKAYLSHMLDSVPEAVADAWQADSAPQSLGFTYAAPISDTDARSAEGGATNIDLAEQAGDLKGSWVMCPLFVLTKPKPTPSADVGKRSGRGGAAVHPFLSNRAGSLALFDEDTVSKSERVLVLGPLVDVKVVTEETGDYLHMYVLDDHDPGFLKGCGVPVYTSTQPRTKEVTTGLVTRYYGRYVGRSSRCKVKNKLKPDPIHRMGGGSVNLCVVVMSPPILPSGPTSTAASPRRQALPRLSTWALTFTRSSCRRAVSTRV